jgi:hypothetical protein
MIKIQMQAMRTFQVVLNSFQGEEITQKIGSQRCITCSPVNELHSLSRECSGKDICVAELYHTVLIMYVSLFCSAVSLVH